MEPHELDYIAAHATATQIGDIAETLAIKDSRRSRAGGRHLGEQVDDRSLLGRPALSRPWPASWRFATESSRRRSTRLPGSGLRPRLRAARLARCPCARRWSTASASAVRTPRRSSAVSTGNRYRTGIVPSCRNRANPAAVNVSSSANSASSGRVKLKHDLPCIRLRSSRLIPSNRSGWT